MSQWREDWGMTQHTPRIALVGDRSANVRAHARIPGLIDALLTRDSIALDPYWIATPGRGGMRSERLRRDLAGARQPV